MPLGCVVLHGDGRERAAEFCSLANKLASDANG
jgi:hypothetical protein